LVFCSTQVLHLLCSAYYTLILIVLWLPYIWLYMHLPLVKVWMSEIGLFVWVFHSVAVWR